MGTIEYVLLKDKYKNPKMAYRHLLDGPENDPEAVSMLEYLEKEAEEKDDDAVENS